MDDVTFSLTPCGPFDRIQAKLGFIRPDSSRLMARAVIIALVAWLPLGAMSLFMPNDSAAITFFHDIVAHVRFLVVIPLLILVEGSIGPRTQMVISDFARSGLVAEADWPRFQSVVRKAQKLAASFWVEAFIMLGTVACVWLVSRELASDQAVFWYEEVTPEGTRLTWTGRWYMFVSSPIVMFLFARWGWRYFVWSWFLRKMSRLGLQISRTHPDRAGGLAFVNIGQTAFAAISFAASCVLAAAGANRIFYEGGTFKDYQSVIAGFVVLSVLLGLAPLLTFLRPLIIAKRKGIMEYGRFGSRYVRAFEEKWLREGVTPDEPMLGSGDIQSLADLGGGYERLDKMSVVPFDRRTLLAFAIAAALPMLPLLLTEMNLRDMVKVIVKAMV